jgi:hypothetical protein
MSKPLLHLAQANIALPIEPLDSARLADFVAAIAPINALADTSPGFVWRLGDATSVRGFGDDRLIINMSTWTSLDALADYAFKSAHADVMRERRRWFVPMKEAYSVLWWVPEGHRPTMVEAEERLAHLRAHGPTPYAFTFKRPFEGTGASGARQEECPV